MKIRMAYRIGAGGGMPRSEREIVHELCATVDLVVVVGEGAEGKNRLAAAVRDRGCPLRRVASASQLQAGWFRGVERVGVAADEGHRAQAREVVEALERLGEAA